MWFAFTHQFHLPAISPCLFSLFNPIHSPRSNSTFTFSQEHASISPILLWCFCNIYCSHLNKYTSHVLLFSILPSWTTRETMCWFLGFQACLLNYEAVDVFKKSAQHFGMPTAPTRAQCSSLYKPGAHYSVSWVNLPWVSFALLWDVNAIWHELGILDFGPSHIATSCMGFGRVWTFMSNSIDFSINKLLTNNVMNNIGLYCNWYYFPNGSRVYVLITLWSPNWTFSLGMITGSK